MGMQFAAIQNKERSHVANSIKILINVIIFPSVKNFYQILLVLKAIIVNSSNICAKKMLV